MDRTILRGAARLWLVGMATIVAVTGIALSKQAAPASAIATGLAVNGALLAVACIIGAATARKSGLVSLIAAGHSAAANVRGLFTWAGIGLVVGLVIALADAAAFRYVPALVDLARTHAELFAKVAQVGPGDILLRMLYGGVVEEILIRWCLLSLIAWALLAARCSRSAAVVGAILASSILFGAGHLPGTYALFGAPPAEMLVRVVALNSVAGIVFGWAYARQSLEAAMLCHAAAHIGLLLSTTTAF